MKTRKLYLILLLLIGINCILYAQNSGLNIRINYNVNLLHFVDHLSQWSQYTGNDAKDMYTKSFKITDEDKKMLEKYSASRNTLGWDAEIDLFNWAYNDFSQESIKNKEQKQEYANLKTAIEYFSQKDKGKLDKFLRKEFKALEKIESDINEYASYLHTTLKTINNYLTIWTNTDKINYSDYPIYICFAHNETSTHGGANGNGVYSEFICKNGESGILSGFDVITHELVHKITNIGEFILEFIQNEEVYTEKADKFLETNELTKEKLKEAFESVDPQGMGNPEFKTFEETNVYLIAPIIIRKMSTKIIAETSNQYKLNGMFEQARIWHGAYILKKMYDGMQSTDLNKTDFIWDLIKVYYEKIYFKNYNSIEKK